MASQVPYTGTTDVAPQVNPLSNVHVDTPIAAFGGAVAGAITHMGETAEGAGKELFARGYAMQELNEQMKADAAAADVTDKMTNRYLEYDKLKGQDRVAGFPQYQEDLSKIRQSGADQLQSPYAKVQYLRDSRRAESTMIWHGGMLARQGQDEANTISSNAKIDAATNRLAVTGTGEGPDFDRTMGDAKTTAGQYVTERFGLHPGDPAYDDKVQEVISPHAAKIASQIGKGDPAKGKELLDKYTKSGLVSPADALKYGPQLDNAIETKTSREVAHNVAQGDPKYWGDEKYSNETSLEGLKASATGSYNSVGKDLPDGTHSVGRYGPNSKLVAANLPEMALINEAGNAVKTEADFLQSPKAQNEFAQTMWAKTQSDAKNYKEAYKTWTGDDNPTRLGAALNAVAKNSDPSVVSGKARDAAAAKVPNSPVAQDNAAEIAANSQYRSRRIEDLSAMRDRNEIIGMVNGQNTLDGRVPQSLDEALRDPKFAERYYKLPEDDQTAVIKILHQNGELGGVRENSVGMSEYTRLKSVMINRDTSSTPKELEEATSANLLQLPISPAHRSELMGLQHKVMQGEIANPNMTHGMGLPAVQKLLTDAGITKTGNPDAYEKFTNAYHDALVGYGQGAERSVKQDQEFTDVAKGLISDHASSWMGWLRGEKQPYKDLMNTNAALKKQGESLFYKTYGRSLVPDDPKDADNANHLLLQAIYNKYGAAAKPAAPKPGAQP